MSVLDQVRALEQQVLQRLREVGPLVAEYRDLQKVAERLGLKHDDAALEAAAREAAEPAPQGKPAAKRRAKRSAVARASTRGPAAQTNLKAAAKPKTAAKRKSKAATNTKPKP